jgi:hypothetical protein
MASYKRLLGSFLLIKPAKPQIVKYLFVEKATNKCKTQSQRGLFPMPAKAGCAIFENGPPPNKP